MASLRLPERLRGSLLALASADDTAVAELLERLAEIDPVLDTQGIPDRVAEQLKSWDKGTGRSIVYGLVALCAFRAEAAKSSETLIDEVIESLSRVPDEETTARDGLAVLDTKKADILRSRLSSLLRLQAFSISAKALGVLTDHQRAFLSVRVLSDIRSVFADDVTIGPAGAVIVHSLKIEFRETGAPAPKAFFVALDSADLDTLLEVVNRAKAKDTALRKTLESGQIPFLAPKTERPKA